MPHIWTLANIVPIPKSNKDIDKGRSCRPISLLSIIANTLEKSIILYITANIPNTPTQHGYKTLYSDGIIHSKQQSKGVQPNGSPCANNHCSTRYEQSFRHNKHTHTNQKAATDKNIPGTIIKFIANYIKVRKAYTTYRNHTSKQRQFKTGAPQGGVLSSTQFNIYTSDLPPPRAPVQLVAYADDITITSTHTSTSAAKTYIKPYLHKVFAWTK